MLGGAFNDDQIANILNNSSISKEKERKDRTTGSSNYSVKRNFKNQMTDLYMEFLEMLDNFQGYTVKILKYLNDDLERSVIAYNKKFKQNLIFGVDIAIIYKGGNVINLYNKQLKSFIDKILGDDMFNYDNKLQYKEVTTLIDFKKIPQSFNKKGDWDFSIYYDKNKIANFNVFRKHMCHYALATLTTAGDLLEFKEDSSKKIAHLIGDKLINQNIDFMNKNKSEIGDIIVIDIPFFKVSYIKSKLEKLKFSYKVDSSNVPPRESYLKMPNKDFSKSITRKFDLKMSYGFVAAIHDLRFNIRNSLIDFDLYRYKVNNVMTYTHPGLLFGSTIKYNIPAELIDISFPGELDNSKDIQLNILKTVNSDGPLYKDMTIGSQKYKFLTTYNLFADLVNILYEQQMLPWEDSKYEKRIARLFNMCFINSIKHQDLKQIRYNLKLLIDAHSHTMTSSLDLLRQIFTLVNGEIIFNKTFVAGHDYFKIILYYKYLLQCSVMYIDSESFLRSLTSDEILMVKKNASTPNRKSDGFIYRAEDIKKSSYEDFKKYTGVVNQFSIFYSDLIDRLIMKMPNNDPNVLLNYSDLSVLNTTDL